FDSTAMKALLAIGHQPTSQDVSTQVDLSLSAGRDARFTVLFYSIGRRFRGVVGVLAYFRTQNDDPQLLPDGGFQINYEEDPTHTQERFSNWLERMIVAGLNEWRKTL